MENTESSSSPPHIPLSHRNPIRELSIACIDNSESSRNEDYSDKLPTTRLRAQVQALSAIVRLSAYKDPQYSIIAMAGANRRTEPSVVLTPTKDPMHFVSMGNTLTIGGPSISICTTLSLALMTAKQTTIVKNITKGQHTQEALSRYAFRSNFDREKQTKSADYTFAKLNRVVKIYLFVCSVPKDIDNLKDAISKLAKSLDNMKVAVYLVSFGEALHNIKCIRSFGSVKELSTAFPSTKVIRVFQHNPNSEQNGDENGVCEATKLVKSGYIGSLLLDKLCGKPHNSAKKDAVSFPKTLSRFIIKRKRQFAQERTSRPDYDSDDDDDDDALFEDEEEHVPILRIPSSLRPARLGFAYSNCSSYMPHVVEESPNEPTKISLDVSYISKANTVNTINIPMNLYPENNHIRIPAGTCEEYLVMDSGKKKTLIDCKRDSGFLVIRSVNSIICNAFWVNSETGSAQFDVNFFKGELSARLQKLPDGRAIVLTISRKERPLRKVFWLQVSESEMPSKQIEYCITRCVGFFGRGNPITSILSLPKLNSVDKLAPQKCFSPFIRSCKVLTVPLQPQSSRSSSSQQQQQIQKQQPLISGCRFSSISFITSSNIINIQHNLMYQSPCGSLLPISMAPKNVALVPIKRVTFTPFCSREDGRDDSESFIVFGERARISNVQNTKPPVKAQQPQPSDIVKKEALNDGGNNTANNAKTVNKNEPSKKNGNGKKAYRNGGRGATKKVKSGNAQSSKMSAKMTKGKAKTISKRLSSKKNLDKVIVDIKTNYAIDQNSGLRRSLRLHNKLMNMTSSNSMSSEMTSPTSTSTIATIESPEIINESSSDITNNVSTEEEIGESAGTTETSADVIIESSTPPENGKVASNNCEQPQK